LRKCHSTAFLGDVCSAPECPSCCLTLTSYPNVR
jgi:hypothetical protein